jgi:hypothetical protein
MVLPAHIVTEAKRLRDLIIASPRQTDRADATDQLINLLIGFYTSRLLGKASLSSEEDA